MSEQRFGVITPYRWKRLAKQGIHLRVFYHGRDITSICRWADDTGDGSVEVILKDLRGKVYFAGTGTAQADIATEIINGVTFQEGPPTEHIRPQADDGEADRA